MKNIYKYTLITFLGLGSIFWSCTQEEYDDYKKFAADGEISYTERIDSLKAFSGNNRIMLQGVVNADPKITELRVFWNDKRDSLSLPVTRSEGIDTLEVMIEDIPENIYNFELRTYDAKGNKSLASNITGTVYGERYQNTLFNRPVTANNLIEDSLAIAYAGMDLSSGVIGTEVVYTNTADVETTVFVPIDEDVWSITDFKPLSTYQYRTVFKPEETAIDTFYTEYVSFTPISKPVLVNAAIPFKASSISGRWGILEDWTTTEPVKIHNGHGGWDEWNGNIFNMESGWGAPAITNGKIYQSVTNVQPASYILNVLIRDTNHSLTDEGGSYFVVAKGDALPDVSDVQTADNVLVYKRINAALGNEYTYRLEFSLDENSTITVGQITTQKDGNPGRFCNVRSWDIVVSE
ncbi:DUF4998 domain-containing protein [Leeuwenhoekiella blandensis]|uniref:DUF5013 domain-containing protein n=1 Tax=Leeuwenhoekiella blandensis (strain CECT 7118 / CCUG 51940 / KCTC 22103 / MED217) TaxID=398720 RepID=A3XNK7_LEEBM|nr:DUF4998 domain-containing protein [Leeuwenhoekiella blandensis]EAQ48864.1 hypothetical protein MED217_09957 [Leeuwenhoekiella blandensis MED217]